MTMRIKDVIKNYSASTNYFPLIRRRKLPETSEMPTFNPAYEVILTKPV